MYVHMWETEAHVSSGNVGGKAQQRGEVHTLAHGEAARVDVELLAVSHHTRKRRRLLLKAVHSDLAL